MRNVIIGVTWALLCASGTYAQQDPLSADWERAELLDSLGKYAQSVKILDQLVEVPAWEYRARARRSGILFSRLGRYDDAFNDASALIRLAPDSMAPYLNRASMYLDMAMPERALADLDDALPRCRNGKDSVAVLVNIGAAHTQVRRSNEAVAAYDRALAIDPTDVAARSNKAIVVDDLGRFDEAHAIFMGLHAEDPTNIVIMNNLGFQESHAGHHAEALAWFEKARELSPDDPYVLNNLGYAQLQAGNVNDALKNVERSIKLNPGNSYAYRNLGLIWKAKNNMEKACDAFEAALARGFTKQYGPEVEEWRRADCH